MAKKLNLRIFLDPTQFAIFIPLKQTTKEEGNIQLSLFLFQQ